MRFVNCILLFVLCFFIPTAGTGHTLDEVMGKAPSVALAEDKSVQGAVEPREVAFISSSVMRAEKIADELPQHAQLLFLADDVNGLWQITDYLARCNDIDTVRIISHGNAGKVVLNSESVDTQYLTRRYEWIESWGNALSENADILLYGCNLAATAEGRTLVQSIADMTGADVAASTDMTGASGNWELEYQVGEIEAVSLAVDGYAYHLANQVVTNSNDSGAGSFRQAIDDVGEGEEITFDADYTITLSSQLSISKSMTITGRGAANTIIQANANPDTAFYNVFGINAGTVILQNMTIRHGRIYADGGGIFSKFRNPINTQQFYLERQYG